MLSQMIVVDKVTTEEAISTETMILVASNTNGMEDDRGEDVDRGTRDAGIPQSATIVTNQTTLHVTAEHPRETGGGVCLGRCRRRR